MSTAFITILLTNNYLPGSLVLSKQLSKFHPTVHKIIIISNEISSNSKDLLELYYDEIIVLENLIQSQNLDNLKLFDRPDLKFTLSKINIFKLIQFDKLIYFDADILPLKPLPENVIQLPVKDTQVAASPDASWPDIFNSGFLVLKPSLEKFDQLNENLLNTFDGADQGLLNQFYKDWIKLPFLFNVTVNYSQNHYEYLPLLNHFRNDIYNVHFIGKHKPWFDRDVSKDSTGFYKQWWDFFNLYFTDLAGDIFNSASAHPDAVVLPATETKSVSSGGPQGHKLNESKVVNAWDSLEEEKRVQSIEETSYPPPIFPWEEHRVKPTRVWGPDSEYLETLVLEKLSDLDIEEEAEQSVENQEE